MEKTFDPEKYEMVFCPICKGKGKLPRNASGFDVCRLCGGFGLIKKESEIFLGEILKTEIGSGTRGQIFGPTTRPKVRH